VWDADSQAIPWTTAGRGNFAVSRDGKWTAEAGWGYVKLWDAGSGWPVWNLSISRHPMLAVAFAPDSRSLAAAQDDGRLWVIDVASGAVRRELRRQPSGVLSLIWSVLPTMARSLPIGSKPP
jgi:WD40 repeat protein